MTLIVKIVLVAFLAFLPVLSLAQTVDTAQTSCFDYYKFQSVEIDLHAEKQVYKAGEGLNFVGFLTNKNTYPVVDGKLILRVSKFDPRSQLGGDIIEEWVAKDNINLLAGEKGQVSFPYQLASGLSTGTYILTSFFLTQDKFNLSGLSFTDDIYGGYETFSVEGLTEKVIKFDRAGVQVDGNNYRIFGFLPQVFEKNTKKLLVEVPLKNEKSDPVKATVTYSFYNWDSADDANLIKTWTEIVDLPKQGAKTLSANLNLSDRTVYYLKIVADTGDQKSEIHIRLVKDGFSPRLNFVGVTQFPMTEAGTNTLFACYHNTANTDGLGRVDLSVKGSDGTVLSDVSFAGKMTGSIDVLTKDISKLSGQDKIVLTAMVYDDKNNLLDSVEIPYDCSKFIGDFCSKIDFNMYYFGGGLILIIISLYFLMRHFKNKETQPPIV